MSKREEQKRERQQRRAAFRAQGERRAESEQPKGESQEERRASLRAVLNSLWQVRSASGHEDCCMRREIDRRHIRLAPYGFRIEGGRATKHPDEMPALRRILGMRLKGVSLRGIAQWLDEQGVPTRRRGKGWHSQVVKLIADRMIGEKGSRGTKAERLSPS